MRVFTSPTLIPAGNAASTKTPTVSFGNIFPRSMNSPGSQTKTCNKWKIFLTTARARLLVTGPRTKYFSNNDLLHFQIEFANTNPNSNLNLTYTGTMSFGTCPAGRWIVAGGDIATGAQFNVLVVNP